MIILPDANAYTAGKNNDRAWLRLLSDCRHRGPKLRPLAFSNRPPEPISGLTVFGIVPAVPALDKGGLSVGPVSLTP